MKVETKYNIGQKVYFRNDYNDPNYGKIKSLEIVVNENGIYISYKIKNTLHKSLEEYSNIFEEYVFENKKDLENYLIEKVKKSFDKVFEK